MSNHPSPEVLQRLLRGELSRQESRPVIGHLVHGCAFCRAAMAPVPEELFEDDEQPSLVQPPEPDIEVGSAYDQVIDRSFSVIGTELSAAIGEAQLVDQAYRALVADGLPGLFRGGRPFHGPVECLALLRRSQDLVYRDPEDVLQLTWFAAFGASNLDPAEWGKERVADLRARAWAELGNARRVMGHLDDAEQAMVTASEQFLEGSQDPPLAARLASLQASLLGAQRHFPEALGLLERAEATYREIGETAEAARALVKRGIYSGYAGLTDAGIDLLTEGVAQLAADAQADPKLVVTSVNSLAWFLMDAERWSKAQELLWRTKTLYEEHAGPIVLVKRTWLEARISAGLGHLDTAEKALSAAIKDLNQAGLGYPAAIATLDLAAVRLRLGRSGALLDRGGHLVQAHVLRFRAYLVVALSRRAPRVLAVGPLGLDAAVAAVDSDLAE